MNSNKNTLRSALKDEITCAVCQEIYDKPQALLPCLHTFCLDCVNFIPGTNHENRITCPICRNRSTSYVANFAIQSFIDIFNNSNLSESVVNDNDERVVEATNIIERIELSDTRPNYGPLYDNGESSSSSYQSVRSERDGELVPCRSCSEQNETNYQCPVPISYNSQDSYGHILCEFCYKYMPARGKNGVEPAFDQCCSFCGIIACDAYWGCSNRSRNAKLYKLSDISNIASWLKSIDSIQVKEEGHLNIQEIEDLLQFLRETGTSWNEAWSICLTFINENYYRTPLLTRMTPAAHEVYNTHRLPKYHDSSNLRENDEEDGEDEDEDYFDQISEKGIVPSDHLRSCSRCLPSIVNGQFYGYWKNLIENDVVEDTKAPCVHGIKCWTQWRNGSHADRWRHVELDASITPF